MDYRIREHSLLARIASWKLGSPRMAIVFGSTIYLHNVSRQQFEADKCWLKHELKHVDQFRQHGFFLFLLKYLAESIRHGYDNNKYELEARAAEQAPDTV